MNSQSRDFIGNNKKREEKKVDADIYKKNLRYKVYASKYKIQYKDEDSLIVKCNNHRNVYIAMKVFKNANDPDKKVSLGYSRCDDPFEDCDNNVLHCHEYNYIVCKCEKYRWELLPLPDPENGRNFDITTKYANGGVVNGDGVCNVFIESDDEDDVDVLNMVAEEMVSVYGWPLSYYNDFLDDQNAGAM